METVVFPPLSRAIRELDGEAKGRAIPAEGRERHFSMQGGVRLQQNRAAARAQSRGTLKTHRMAVIGCGALRLLRSVRLGLPVAIGPEDWDIPS